MNQERNDNTLRLQNGESQVTVKDFLADVQLIQQGKKPQNITIGLQFTEFQNFKDEEKRIEEERVKGNFKLEIETAKRIINDIKNQKKKNLKVYEKLEKQLTQFEIQEEAEIMKLMENSEQGSNDSYSSNRKDILISQHNIFSDGASGPKMIDQDDIEKKLEYI